MPLPKLLTIDEIASYLRINRFTVYRMANRGDLPGIRVANLWWFKEKDIEKWLEKNKLKFNRKKKR